MFTEAGAFFFTLFWGSKSWHRDLNIGILHSEITVKFSYFKITAKKSKIAVKFLNNYGNFVEKTQPFSNDLQAPVLNDPLLIVHRLKPSKIMTL